MGLPQYEALAAIADGAGARKIRGIVDMESIDRDVERSTIAGIHSNMDACQLELHHAALRRLLRAWCVLRPDIGYAQSMNLIASFSLAIFAEEESRAFTLFCGLMARLDPQFHAQSPPLLGFHIEVDALIELLDTYVPALARPCEGEGSPLSLAEAGEPTSGLRRRRSSFWQRLTSRPSKEPTSPSPNPNLWERLTSWPSKEDTTSGAVPAAAAELEAARARRLHRVREVLRLWCCRCFLPLWVGMLPVESLYGAWQLLLVGDVDADAGADAEEGCGAGAAVGAPGGDVDAHEEPPPRRPTSRSLSPSYDAALRKCLRRSTSRRRTMASPRTLH